jgi:hypothetical protein
VTKLSTGTPQFFQESDLDRLIDVGRVTNRINNAIQAFIPRLLIALPAVLASFS